MVQAWHDVSTAARAFNAFHGLLPVVEFLSIRANTDAESSNFGWHGVDPRALLRRLLGQSQRHESYPDESCGMYLYLSESLDRKTSTSEQT